MAAEASWNNRGDRSLDDLRAEIMEKAGGIQPPAWHRGGPSYEEAIEEE